MYPRPVKVIKKEEVQISRAEAASICENVIRDLAGLREPASDDCKYYRKGERYFARYRSRMHNPVEWDKELDGLNELQKAAITVLEALG